MQTTGAAVGLARAVGDGRVGERVAVALGGLGRLAGRLTLQNPSFHVGVPDRNRGSSRL